MGLHIGTPRQVRDNMTRRIEYTGPDVCIHLFIITIEMINNIT